MEENKTPQTHNKFLKHKSNFFFFFLFILGGLSTQLRRGTILQLETASHMGQCDDEDDVDDDDHGKHKKTSIDVDEDEDEEDDDERDNRVSLSCLFTFVRKNHYKKKMAIIIFLLNRMESMTTGMACALRVALKTEGGKLY